MSEHPTTAGSAETSPTQRSDKPVKLVAIVAGLSAVICLMLFAFAAPGLNSGAQDLPLAVGGPEAATAKIVDGLEAEQPGAFEVSEYATATEVIDAVHDREAIGGISIGANGAVIHTAAGAGTPYKALLTGIGSGLEQSGQQVTYDEVAPTTEDDPNGNAIAALGFPLMFGGMAASAVLLLAYKGRAINRFLAVTVLAITAGLATTAILQFGFGAFDNDYLLIAASVAAGILAISFTVLGLEQRFGTAGLGMMAVVLIFISNPLSGLATGPQWLPGVWGEVGQFFPIGAAGTAVRSAAYFDGAGSLQAWIVLACWAAFGLTFGFVANRLNAGRAANA